MHSLADFMDPPVRSVAGWRWHHDRPEGLEWSVQCEGRDFFVAIDGDFYMAMEIDRFNQLLERLLEASLDNPTTASSP
jgi:hypothetical protein